MVFGENEQNGFYFCHNVEQLKEEDLCKLKLSSQDSASSKYDM